MRFLLFGNTGRIVKYIILFPIKVLFIGKLVLARVSYLKCFKNRKNRKKMFELLRLKIGNKRLMIVIIKEFALLMTTAIFLSNMFN